MNISETRSGDVIQIQIDGRVDTTTSPQLQNAILQAFQKGNKLVNVAEAVLQVFKMSGFSGILHIE